MNRIREINRQITQERARQKRLTMAASALALASIGAISTAMPFRAPAAAFAVYVTDAQGNLYIAGRGDTCTAAWQGAQLPIGWQDAICKSTDY